VGGATEGSNAESKDPEDLSRDHAAAGSSLETLSFDFQFWAILAVPAILAISLLIRVYPR
jgi:hypothetical protein